MVEAQVLRLSVDGLHLSGAVFMPQDKGPHPSLILCHGLPSGRPSMASEPGYPELARRFCAAGFATLIFNFRGTGESEGNFDILGWGRDLKCVTDYMVRCPGVDTYRLYVLGSSAGGAVAVYRAALDPRLAGAVVWASPAHWGFGADAHRFLQHARSIGIIRDPAFPPSMARWAEGFQEVCPEKLVHRISPRPLLIVHGEADDVVPVEQARRLYEAAERPKELCVLPGVGHRLRLEEAAVEISLTRLREWAGLSD